MILIAWGKNRWRWLLLELLLVLCVVGASVALMHFGFALSLSALIMNTLRISIMMAFVILGWRDLLKLFQRPAKNMGTGFNRIWSVGRTTLLEAWAGRVWLLPALWFISSMILINSVRPFDESERIPLYIRMLLSSQEVLLLVMIWVMACVSLPRERERKTIITTASKPLSRLEIVLGKIVGFGAAAGLLLAFMGAVSLAILYVSDFNLKNRAREAYDLQKQDFAKNLKAPSESLLRLSEEGSLFAYNYITAPKDGMSIGAIAFSRDGKEPPIRYLMGGTQEKAIYRFRPRLEVPEGMLTNPPGARPYFVFFFPISFTGAGEPSEVQLRIAAYRSDPRASPPPRYIEKTLRLAPNGLAYWEPDDLQELYSTYNDKQLITRDVGEVSVEVQCMTPGVLLQVLEGKDANPLTGEVPSDTDFNVDFTNRDPQHNTQEPLAHPVVRGFERRERQEVSGGKAGDFYHEFASYRIPGSSLRNVPLDAEGNFTLSLNLETYKEEKPDLPTIAHITVRSFDAMAATPFEAETEVLEKRNMTIKVPAQFLGDQVPSKRGDLLILVYARTPGHSISLVEDSVRIELPRSIFAVNLFKSEAVIFLEALLIIAISVACSIRVGWPVAMFCSSVCFTFGYFVGWIKGLQEYGGLAALNYSVTGQKTFAIQFFDATTGVMWKILGVFASFVPDFSGYQPLQFIPSLHSMPWSVLAGNFLDTVIFIIPIVAIAYLLIRKQELG